MKRIVACFSLTVGVLVAANQPTQVVQLAKDFLGSRYVWGGTTPEGFDCSGYVQYLYKKYQIDLPRTAWEQSKVGREVEPDELKKGDLLFFLTDPKRNIPITHVGIYQGNGKFIHAASKKEGVIISPVDQYMDRFVIAKRIIDTPMNISEPVFPAQKAPAEVLKSATALAWHFDPLVVHNGRYVRQSQIKN
ncbi:MAG: C40 family peptidase [Sulfurovum sp.]